MGQLQYTRKYCMEGPIVSIDVSNGNSHYMCFIKNNKRFGKVLIAKLFEYES